MTEAEARKRELARRLAQFSLPTFAQSPLASRSEPFKRLLDQLEERRKLVVIDTYVERLTVDELHELVRFYESDVGQSFVKTFPILEERTRELFETLGREGQLGALGTGTLGSATFTPGNARTKQDPSK